MLQFFLIWLGTLLIPILGLISCGGWSRMMATIQENVKVIHPTVSDADFTCLWHNLGSFADNPMGIDWFGMVFGQGLAISFAYWCTDFLQVQRVIVAKDLRAAQNGTIIGSVLKMCVPLIVTLPGLLGLALLTNTDGSPMVLVPESDPRAMITNHTFNDVLPLLMGKYLGPGLLGLGVTAMIAGFMSGMAGNVSAFATVWTYDVYRPLAGPQRQRPPLSQHGPLVLDGRRAAVDRHRLLVVLLLEHSRIPPSADLLLHRAAVRRGDPGHVVEAGHARRRLLGLLHGHPVLDRHVGLRPHLPRRLSAAAENRARQRAPW